VSLKSTLARPKPHRGGAEVFFIFICAYLCLFVLSCSSLQLRQVLNLRFPPLFALNKLIPPGPVLLLYRLIRDKIRKNLA
jgi:hypothetical protein